MIGLGLGLAPAINHYLAAGKLDKEKLVSQLFIFSVFSAIIFVVLWFTLEPLGIQKIALPQVLSSFFVIFCLGVHLLLLLFNQLLASVLLAQKKYSKSASISVTAAVLLLVIYVYLHFIEGPIPETAFRFIILANLLVLLVQTVLYLLQIVKLKGFSLSFAWFDFSMIKVFFAFAVLAYFTNFLQFLNYKMDVWFINTYVDNKSELGIYGVAVSLAQLIWLVPNAFHSVLFTEVSENIASIDLKHKISRWSKNILLLSLVLGSLGYFLSIWLVPILFSAEYSLVVEVLPFLIPGIVLFAPSILWSAYFAGRGEINVNLKATAIGFIIAIIGGFLIIPEQGIIGAAVVTSVSYAVTSLFTYYQFTKR